jgi:hypothetical protein
MEARAFCNADEVGNLLKFEDPALGALADDPTSRSLITAIPLGGIHSYPLLVYGGSQANAVIGVIHRCDR